jgi:hypothetical protein
MTMYRVEMLVEHEDVINSKRSVSYNNETNKGKVGSAVSKALEGAGIAGVLYLVAKAQK